MYLLDLLDGTRVTPDACLSQMAARCRGRMDVAADGIRALNKAALNSWENVGFRNSSMICRMGVAARPGSLFDSMVLYIA